MSSIVRFIRRLKWWGKTTQPRVVDPARSESARRAAVTRKRRIEYAAALGEIDQYLSVTSYHVKKGRGSYAGLHHTKARDFNFAEPFILSQAFPENYPDSAKISWGANPKELLRPLDVKILGEWLEDNDNDDESAVALKGKATLQRYRQVTPKDVRGRVRFYMPYMVEHRVAYINAESRTAEPIVLYWGTSDYKKWFQIGVALEQAIASPHSIGRLQIALGLAETRQSQWLVGLRQGEQPSLLMPTDPTGVREIFRLRDLPEGRKRRAAMLHWVDGHYRQKHDDPASDTYVRKHLRGATRFTWNGLHCTIKPPIASSEFSLRPDLVASRDEIQEVEASTIPTDLLDYPFTDEEAAMRERETYELLQDVANGTRGFTPANKSGSWVEIGERTR